MKRREPRLPAKQSAAFFDEAGQGKPLMPGFGYQFLDASLLRQALTHPSLSKKGNNQRLEFLGDAVLQLCISHMLFDSTREDEGKLTRRRQQLVSEEALAGIARSIHLGDSLLLSADVRADGGADLDSVLADAMEAVLGAVYMDGGFDAAMAVIQKLWEDRVRTSRSKLDPKGALQALLQARGQEEPVYQQLAVTGPAHEPQFTVQVLAMGQPIACGSGKSKQAAQVAAAQQALKTLKKAKQKQAKDQTGEAQE